MTRGTPRPRTALFLISDTGAGHRSAANAINAAMNLIGAQSASAPPSASSPRHRRDQGANRSWRTVIVDVFAECANFPLKNGVFLYGPAIKHSPRLYSQLFHLTNSASRFNAAYRLSKPFIRQGLTQLLQRYRPDVIVSIHPLLNHITLQVMSDLGVKVPFLTVVTDMVSVHTAWITPGVSACVVATEAAREYAISRGVAPRRVKLLGMPIDPSFAIEPTDDARGRKQALGLDPDLPTILLMGGGEGAGGLAQAAYALGREGLRAQLLVVTGRNRALRAELEQVTDFTTPMRVYGFVENMPELMRASDLIVTKAGPGSISEAMACGLPIILTGYVEGQENGNVDYVCENRLGVFADTTERLLKSVHQLLNPNDPMLEEFRANVRRLSRPRASLDIARLILSYLPGPSAPSAWVSVPRSRRGRLTTALNRRRRWAIQRARRFAGDSASQARRLSALTPLTRTLGSLRGGGRAQRRISLPSLDGARALLQRAPTRVILTRRRSERERTGVAPRP